MSWLLRALIILTISLFSIGCASDGGPSQSADERTLWVVHWSEIANDASGLDHTPPGPGETRIFGEQAGPTRAARALAMVYIAMFDAINSIERRYETYLDIPDAPAGASLKAAVSQAAHDVLVHIYPSQSATFDNALKDNLDQIPDDISKSDGIAAGQLAAAMIIADRTNDGSQFSNPGQPINYEFNDEPGEWRKDPLHPNQSPLTPEWGRVRPFVMDSSSQFRVPPPPALDSQEYADAYNEVKRMGGDGITTPTMRTAAQTIAGIFWGYDGVPSLCAPVKLYNQMLVQIGLENNLELFEMARLLALANVAMADAGIASWESKYYWNFWRPIAGIREADAGTGPTGLGDNNPATSGDPEFVPLGAPANNGSGTNFTPPFPAYPSGHATFGGALFETLRNFFGTDDYSFTFVSDEFNGTTIDQHGQVRPRIPRTFHSFSEAEEENGQSRIYLGIHWSFDKTEGITQGRKVSNLTTERLFRPLQ